MTELNSLLPKLKLVADVVGYLGKPGTVDEIDVKTAIAANVWELGQDSINQEPFPSVGKNDCVLDEAFEIPDDSWGRVWFQKTFWLHHKASGIKSRWINGRTAPQD